MELIFGMLLTLLAPVYVWAIGRLVFEAFYQAKRAHFVRMYSLTKDTDSN